MARRKADWNGQNMNVICNIVQWNESLMNNLRYTH